jgi:nucleoside-diphosphate-sugar epimerase
MTERIMVTGAAGFIGSHLCDRLLRDGHEVVGVDNLSDYYDLRLKRDNLDGLIGDDRFEFHERSLNDLDLDAALEGVSVIFHQAAQAGVRASWGRYFETYIDANIRATQRLLEAVKERRLKRFLFAGSSSVYGETARLPMHESHPTRPVSPYGVTKLSAENLCLLYKKNFQVPVVCLRYFTVYGPRQRPDMAFYRVLQKARCGEPVTVFGNGTQTRDFTFIDDIVEANLLAMDYSGNESVFNIGGGSRVALNRVLDILHELNGARFEILYQEACRGDVTHTFSDISLAGKELGYSPQVGIGDGLARQFEWFNYIYKKFGALQG